MKKSLLFFFSAIICLVFLTSHSLVSATETTEFDTTKQGVTFDRYSLYSTDKAMSEIPVTYEAWIKVPENLSEEGGVIYGNSGNGKNPSIRLRITPSGYAQLYFYGSKGSNKALTVLFDCARLNTGKWTHLTVIDDYKNQNLMIYLNGELRQTLKMPQELTKYTRSVKGNGMCIGGDYCTGQSLAFRGEILSIAVFGDVRTAEEIKADMSSINLNDDNLISCYNLAGKQGSSLLEDLKGKYTVTNNRNNNDWIDYDSVLPPKDFAYSIAVLGDTQIISGYYPNDFHKITDWLLENKDSHKIEHVLNVGDMTNFNTDAEWELVRNEYFRLNGIIDYTLVRGDHDTNDDKVENNGDDQTKYDRVFGVDAYLDRLKQPDSDYYRGKDGSITNSYRAIEICNNKYLIVTLDKNAKSTVIDWAKKAIEKYPDHRVIITTHCYLEANGNPGTDATITGKKLFGYFKEYKNIEFILSGHMYAYGVVWTKQQGTNGNVINQVLVNPQGPMFDANGAAGMIAMLYFSEDGTEVELRYYSAIQDKYYNANYNPVTGTYAIDTSCFKISTDNMDPATPLVFEQATQAIPTKAPPPADNPKYDDNKNDILPYIIIGGAVVTVIVSACIILILTKQKNLKP